MNKPDWKKKTCPANSSNKDKRNEFEPIIPNSILLSLYNDTKECNGKKRETILKIFFQNLH